MPAGTTAAELVKQCARVASERSANKQASSSSTDDDADLPEMWAARARKLGPLARSLLFDGAKPSSVSAYALIHEITEKATLKTYEKSIAALSLEAQSAVLRAPSVLDANACKALREAVNTLGTRFY